MKEETPHKHLVFVLNKCDLVPTNVAVCDPTRLLYFYFANSIGSHCSCQGSFVHSS